MWALENHTQYAVGKAWGRDKEGVHEWIVAVKAAFDVEPDGSLRISETQVPPLLAPELNGDDGTSSLRYDADFAGTKPTTDVVLNGMAYAPNGRPSTNFFISMRLGSILKKIQVVGTRTWQSGLLGLQPSAMEPVTRVPIVYERAYGGYDDADPDPQNQRMDSRNPVGCGLVPREGEALPNFMYPSGSLETSGPAGFGAIPSYWSPRRELTGTYNEKWKQSRYPLVPADWDPRSLLCSPADQRPETYLDGGETVELTNLTPSGLLRFALPALRFRFHTVFSTGYGMRVKEHKGHLATVIVEPDIPRVILVWLSVLLCRADGDYLEETIVREEPNLR
jgi:hypothetical protein